MVSREKNSPYFLMWKIGDIRVVSKVVLAPMAGITSLAYREFMKPFGVGLSYTEMISDCGLSYNNSKTYEYLTFSGIDHPVGLQLFGSKIDKTLKAIKILQDNKIPYDVLDINLGCPVFKVVKTGAGSAWLKDPQGLFSYMKAICETSTKPVTAKIRLGWDEKSINVFEIVSLLEKAGVKAISIHARTTKQLYSGIPNYESIRDMRKHMSVPLIVSGDIYSLEDAINAIKITGADAVMIARGGIGNPMLIRQINEYFDNGIILPNPSLDENLRYLENYAEMLVKEKGERTAMMILRGIAPKFLNHYSGLKQFKTKMSTDLKTLDDLKAIDKEILSKV